MGRPPSLASWWRCCQCSREVNPAQYGDGCPDCGHESCLYYCTRYGGGGGGGGSGGSSWGNLPSATTSAQPPASTREPTKVSPADSSKHPTEASSSSSTTKGAQRLLKPKIALFDEEEPWPKIEKGPRSRHRRSTEKDTDVSAQLDPQLVGGTLVEGSDSDYADDESVSLPPKARTPKPLELPFHHSSDGIGSGINSATSNASLFVGCYTWIGSFLHAPPKPGLTRVTWKCACGANLYDDYEELEEGAANELQKELNCLQSPAYIRQRWTSTGILNQALKNTRSLLGGIASLVSGTYRLITNKRTGRPSHELESQPKTTQQSHGSHVTERLFLLLCIGGNTSNSATRAYQPTVHDVDSDRKLFQKLHHYHSSIRKRWWSFISLWELQHIHFVYFDMYEKSLVDIKEVNAVPPSEFATQYRYEPSKVKPPIGSNLLMHYLRCPEDASETAPCLRRMPKKLNDQLVACPNNGVSPGWGLHFEEGWSWKKILTGLCFLFILASVLEAVLYWRFEHSAQDSLALGTFMLACFSVVVATLQAWLSVA